MISKKEKSYWLIKSEGACYSIDDLKKDGKTAWTGVRNFQARNFMTKDMKAGDEILFYHSSSDPSGIFGLAKVCSEAHADFTAQDKKDEHYDPKATKKNPIWMCVDLEFVTKFGRPITLSEMRLNPILSGMATLRKGSRLSITPVSKKEFDEAIRISHR